MSHREGVNGATLHACLDRFLNSSNKWPMQFNIETCKVMHFGRDYPCREYTMGVAKLMMTGSDKYLGVVIHSALKPATHIAITARKAHQILGMIRRTITYKNKRIILLVYKSWLEYVAQAISSHQLGHIRLIRMIPELKKLPYETISKRLNIYIFIVIHVYGTNNLHIIIFI